MLLIGFGNGRSPAFVRIFGLFVSMLLAALWQRRRTNHKLAPIARRLQLPGGEAPFGLEVAQENDRFVLYLVNDTERTRVDNVTLPGGELTAVFPGYENSLRANMYRDRLEGRSR